MGGACSLANPAPAKFPANREKYREFVAWFAVIDFLAPMLSRAATAATIRNAE